MAAANKMELVYSLIGYPEETEWLEFKDSAREPERIGRDISALANAAAFLGRDQAYKIWGIKDQTHELIGTTFDPYTAKGKGNQDLLIWLKRFLSANASYVFDRIEHDGLVFVVLKVRAAIRQPVYFDDAAYIREGSSTTRLTPGSAREAELWRRLQSDDYEHKPAERDVTAADIPKLIDVSTYFDLLGLRQPTDLQGMLTPLLEQELIRIQDNGRYEITNLGALLIAKRLGMFPHLRKRCLRIVRFADDSSFEIVDDVTFEEGYASVMQQAERHILSSVPAQEVVDGAFRRIRRAYPQRAVRELLSNALIHQDLSDVTAGPVVSIHANRIEFSNPGSMLVPRDRLLNAQPKTRNESLAGLLRQMGLCEEMGTGWDLVVAACEAMHMAAPRVESDDATGTRVTLFGDRAYGRMTKRERREALYWHACLLYAQGGSMNNQSLRERFDLEATKSNMVAMSRLIRECCESGLIKEEDEEAGTKFKRYVPAWA